MNANGMKRVYLYTRYERLWHWLQTAVILILLVTGLEVHGVIDWFGFKTAVNWHNWIGLTWLVAFAFFVFWIFTTGEWRQYVPTTRKLMTVVAYYLHGIFRGEPHPVPKRKEAKHNPLQRLTYLMLAAILLPIQMATGLLYWGYNQWPQWGISGLNLNVIAIIHTAGAFALLSFLIVHVYMITTGHSIFAHFKAMISGWEDVQAGVEIETWERAK